MGDKNGQAMVLNGLGQVYQQLERFMDVNGLETGVRVSVDVSADRGGLPRFIR
ncbi:MAG: hypothetical protein GY859_27335 [Desulfobacterales bacterium]|nr:hypothetical protein [Desulfobacterales bacterium]